MRRGSRERLRATEARSASGDFSEPVLFGVLAALSGQPAEQVVHEAVGAILRFQPRPRDDMAILVLAPEP